MATIKLLSVTEQLRHRTTTTRKSTKYSTYLGGSRMLGSQLICLKMCGDEQFRKANRPFCGIMRLYELISSGNSTPRMASSGFPFGDISD
jgi:hypothetical protein